MGLTYINRVLVAAGLMLGAVTAPTLLNADEAHPEQGRQVILGFVCETVEGADYIAHRFIEAKMELESGSVNLEGCEWLPQVFPFNRGWIVETVSRKTYGGVLYNVFRVQVAFNGFVGYSAAGAEALGEGGA